MAARVGDGCPERVPRVRLCADHAQVSQIVIFGDWRIPVGWSAERPAQVVFCQLSLDFLIFAFAFTISLSVLSFVSNTLY